jgi:hypothetical protein
MYLPEHRHEANLVAAYPSGGEMWYCPTCGQLTLTNWSPAQGRIILVAGDEGAVHLGRIDNLDMREHHMALLEQSEYTQSSPLADFERSENGASTDNEPLLEESLRPWLTWFREAGFAD